MQITILCVGKIKETFLKEGIDFYVRRLQPYCTLKLVEVADEPGPDHLKEEELLLVKEKEGKRLLERIKPDQYVIALDLKGKSLSSEELAAKLEELALYGRSNLVFIIGGSYGLAQEVLKRADFSLSFSKLTFPHQLMRLILLEQIYRSFKIMKGEPYHK